MISSRIHLAILLILLAAGTLAAARAAVAADQTAFDIGASGTNYVLGVGEYSLGYTFTVAANLTKGISVTKLGFLTAGLSGGKITNTTHEVALFDSTGKTIADATVTPDSKGGTDANFTYVALAKPVTLLPGTYDIMGNTNGGAFAGSVKTLTAATGIAFVKDNAAFNTPDLSVKQPPVNRGVFGADNKAFFGPDFQFTPVP